MISHFKEDANTQINLIQELGMKRRNFQRGKNGKIDEKTSNTDENIATLKNSARKLRFLNVNQI